MARTLFKNANVFDGKTPHLLEHHDVLVEDGRISQVSAVPWSGPAETVVDVAGSPSWARTAPLCPSS